MAQAPLNLSSLVLHVAPILGSPWSNFIVEKHQVRGSRPPEDIILLFCRQSHVSEDDGIPNWIRKVPPVKSIYLRTWTIGDCSSKERGLLSGTSDPLRASYVTASGSLSHRRKADAPSLFLVRRLFIEFGPKVVPVLDKDLCHVLVRMTLIRMSWKRHLHWDDAPSYYMRSAVGMLCNGVIPGQHGLCPIQVK